MNYYTAQGVTRESVYTALATQIQSKLGLTDLIRGWVTTNNLNVTQSPVGYLHQTSSKPIQKIGLPPRYIDKARLWVLVAQQNADPHFSASAALNNLRDLLDSAFSPDEGDRRVFTLGGLVEHCWVTDDTIFESLVGGAWTGFRSLIELQYFSVNNM